MLNRIIIISIVLILSFGSLFSQALQTFKASQGLEKAKSEAITNGFASPELVFILCLNTTYKITTQYGTFNVSVKFDFTKGTANTWFYFYRNADNHSDIVVVAVVRLPGFGYQAMKYNFNDLINNDLPFDAANTLEGIQWIDSDVMAQELMVNTDFIPYYNAHQNPEYAAIFLFVNTKYAFVATKQPFWGVLIIDKQTSKLCAIHAENKTVFCNPTSPVESNNQDQLNFYPNPTEGNINILVPEGFFPNKIVLTNYLGEMIKEYSEQDFLSKNQHIYLNLPDLIEGVYFINISTVNTQYHKKIIIKK